MVQNSSYLKEAARHGYRLALGVQTIANAFVARHRNIAVHYGGARVGDVGGPLVKVKRLSERFPDTPWGYNLLYLLSNAPYLPAWAIKLAKSRGTPIAYNQNGVFYGAWYGGDWRAENARMAAAYHAADHVFYQSDFCRRCADRFLGPRGGEGEILFNAVDCQHFSPSAQTNPTPGRAFRFLITGKIGNHLAYRLTSTIGGLAHARKAGLDASLAIAGWVDSGARSEAMVKASSLGVEQHLVFSGTYRQDEAPSIYRAADAYVMMKHNDPCPNTVIEALACGLPVLYSATGGVPELVGVEAGVGLDCADDFERWHVPTNQAIGEGMLKVAAGQGQMAEAARRRAVAHFDIESWLARHAEVFTSLLARPASKG